MSSGKILIVDDDPKVLTLLRATLQREGFTVHATPSGSDALDLAFSWSPDLVILDLSLSGPGSPGEGGPDGMDVLRQLRKQADICVLMLTSTDVSFVKVAALRIGADDFLTKPFDPQELVARVEAILRRAQGRQANGNLLRFRGLEIDLGARLVKRDGDEVRLTRLEFDLLHALVRRPGQVLSRQQLLGQAWERGEVTDDRVVDVHIGHLRKKLEPDPASPHYITTVWGKGYRFEERKR
jgi:two-component system alkaline phosphatase synthesis response regulator PhoP